MRSAPYAVSAEFIAYALTWYVVPSVSPVNCTVNVLFPDASFMHASVVAGFSFSLMQIPLARMSVPPLLVTVPLTDAESTVTPVIESVVTAGTTAFTVSVPFT